MRPARQLGAAQLVLALASAYAGTPRSHPPVEGATTAKLGHRERSHSPITFFISRSSWQERVQSLSLLSSESKVSSVTGGSKLAADAQMDTVVAFGLTFSHLHSGLPFDFSLQPGLLQVRHQSRGTPTAESTRRLMALQRQRRRRLALTEPGRRNRTGAAGPHEHALHTGHAPHAGHAPNAGHAPHAGHAPRARNASRAGQLRFDQRLSRRGYNEPKNALHGNGGDDFTFTFPHGDSALYEVLAFGFDLHDDWDSRNETLSVYDRLGRSLGVYTFGASGGPTSRAIGTSTGGFVGFVSAAPVGYLSFDESAGDDEIGVSNLCFGYRESAHMHRLSDAIAVALFAIIALALLVEQRAMAGVHRVTLRTSMAWSAAWLVPAAGSAALLWGTRGWRPAVLYSLCYALNTSLSCDNLLVFMMLLEQTRLHEAHHRRAISDGIGAALLVRIAVLLCGAQLLQRFGWLLPCFAVFLLGSGLHMLCTAEAPDAQADTEAGAKASPGAEGGEVAPRQRSTCVHLSSLTLEPLEASSDSVMLESALPASPRDAGLADGQHWAIRCIARCVPFDPRPPDPAVSPTYLARDASGRLCATRYLVVVLALVACDVLFCLDSTPVILSISTSPTVLVTSQIASMLGLRALYFLIAALARFVDSIQSALAVVLILIAAKILAETMGYEVPLGYFIGAITLWRVVATLVALYRVSRKRCAEGSAR